MSEQVNQRKTKTGMRLMERIWESVNKRIIILSRTPMGWDGTLLRREGWPIVKYRDTLQCAVQ